MTSSLRWLALGVFAFASQLACGAVPFIFVNADGPNEGLNDPTIVAPIGGNPGTTLGAQRLAALQRVGEIWGSHLSGTLPIRVTVDFAVQEAGMLAGAAPVSIQENFSNAPKPNVWYPIALANHLAGVDLEPSANDISITANSNGAFYYGLDSASPGNLSNFVDTLLHEVGHGLGFISVMSLSNGSLYQGHSDIFTNFIYDEQLNAAWPSLSSAQRLASAKNDPYLVWSGPFTTSGVPSKLQLFQLTSSATASPTTIAQADFGGLIPRGGLTQSLVATSPADACGPLANASALAGKIALIRRGTCDFEDKAYRAQQAGAVAVIFANNVAGDLISPFGDGIVDGATVNISIPVIFISQADGDALNAALPGVQATLVPLAGQFTGTTEGRLRLFAPSTISSGSSVSHWTVDARPNLLMEPIINPLLDRQLDFSLTQMKDIGWRVIDIPFPYLTFDTWKTQVFTTSDTLTAATDDPDKDGVNNLEEYFFGGDPKKSDVTKLPTFQISGSQGKLVYTRSKLFTDLTFSVEKSTTLSGFTTATPGVDYVVESTQSLGSDAEQVTLRVINAPPKLFLRLRINR